MSRLSPREKYWRGLREERLRYRGFYAWEANILKRFPMTRSYMRRVIRERQKLVVKAIREDWNIPEYRYAVLTEYEAKDWLDEGGRPSPYRMIKYYRRISIDLGEYTPPPPRKKGPTENWPRWKGNVAAQKKRWRATHKDQIARSKRQWREKQREKKREGRHVVFNERTGRFEAR